MSARLSWIGLDFSAVLACSAEIDAFPRREVDAFLNPSLFNSRTKSPRRQRKRRPIRIGGTEKRPRSAARLSAAGDMPSRRAASSALMSVSGSPRFRDATNSSRTT